MNTSSRVPGISRNSGWRAIDAEIAARRTSQPADPTDIPRSANNTQPLHHQATRWTAPATNQPLPRRHQTPHTILSSLDLTARIRTSEDHRDLIGATR